MPAQTNSDRLRSWFDKQLTVLKPGEQLPTSASLAKQFGLAERTINTILKEYVAAGKLVRIRGKGTFVPGRDDQDAQVEAPRSSAEHIADAIRQSISAGELRVGEGLPPVKFMCNRFHVTPATVAQAYRLLVREGHAVRVGRTYWIGGFKKLVYPRIGKPVYLFHDEENDFGDTFAADLYVAAYQKMERELASLGYVLRHQRTATFDHLLSSRQTTRTVPYGIVFYRFSRTEYETYVPRLDRLTRQLRGHGLPVPPILIDMRWGKAPRRTPSLSILHRGNLSTSTGKALAQYLVEKKYRRAAFFVDEDLRDTEVRFWNFVRTLKVRIELANLDPDVSVRLCVRPSPAQTTPAGFIEAEGRANEKYGQGYLEALLGKYRQLTLDNLTEEIVLAGEGAVDYASFRDCDIWVFGRMAQAAEALRWCREQRIDVPGRVSILSLRNDPAHFGEGISCCEIDWENIGYLMAHALIGDFPIAKTRQGFIRCRSQIIERGSTR